MNDGIGGAQRQSIAGLECDRLIARHGLAIHQNRKRVRERTKEKSIRVPFDSADVALLRSYWVIGQASLLNYQNSPSPPQNREHSTFVAIRQTRALTGIKAAGSM